MASTMTSSYSSSRTSADRVPADSGSSSTSARSASTKGLSAMLLTAMVSALLVVADQLIDTWADGHLLAAWVALWAVGFTALAVFGGAARKVAVTVIVALDGWSQRVAQTRADERLWAIAQSDPRVMADLQMAIQRGEDEVRTPMEASKWQRFSAKFGTFSAGRGFDAARQRNCMHYI